MKGLKRLLGFIRPYWGLCFISGISLLIFTALGMPMPWFLKLIIDKALGSSDLGLLVLLLGCIFTIYILREIFFYISHYLFYYTGNRILFGVRIKLFKHLQSLSLRFYQEYRTGKLISNILTDVSMLNGMISTVVVNLVIHLFTIVCILTALVIMSPKLSVICFILVPLQAFNFTYFRIIMKRVAVDLRERMSEVSASLAETINGIKVVKSFGKERTESREFAEMLRPTFDASLRLNMQGVYTWIISEAINCVCIILALGWGGYMVVLGEISIGDLVAYYTYLTLLTGPLSALGGLSGAISDGMTSIDRIGVLLDSVPEVKESRHPQELEFASGHLEFQNVNFGYDPSKLVLRDFSLDVKPGLKVALVGPSGSGKSTIASLLMRFFDVTSGSIRLDGLDLRDLSMESLRQNVGIVLQDSFLFSGSVEENIRYGNDHAMHAQVVEAAKMANAHEFIQELPKGYKSEVGENGVSLSGGQKQRIAIARAILKNPRILILDEATSALDTLSEASVQEALDTLMAKRTTIIIAHRLSTVRNADLIVVLQDGAIVQIGKHSELLLQDGVYRNLYAMQLKESTKGSEQLFAVDDILSTPLQKKT